MILFACNGSHGKGNDMIHDKFEVIFKRDESDYKNIKKKKN